MNYLYLFLSVAFNVASYLIYKSIAHRQHDFNWSVIFILGLILGGINVYLFIKALKSINLSIAYPVFSGACLALVMTSGRAGGLMFAGPSKGPIRKHKSKRRVRA